MVRKQIEYASHWSVMPKEEQEFYATDLGYYNGRVRWYVNWISDLLNYWANEHVVLACLMANKHNLFKRWERIVVLLCQLGVSYFLTVYTHDYYYEADQTNPGQEDFYIHPVLIGTSLALIAYTELLKILIVAGCFQPYGCLADSGRTLKMCFREVSHLGVTVCVFISSILVIIGAVDDRDQEYKGFLIHSAVTWGLSFITDALMFSYYYAQQKHHKSEKAYPIKGLPSPMYITKGQPCLCCCLFHAKKRRNATSNDAFDGEIGLDASTGAPVTSDMPKWVDDMPGPPLYPTNQNDLSQKLLPV